MKKIMFNDKYGLTEAVLERRKTQTRRILKPTMLFERLNTYEGWEKEDIADWKESCKDRLYKADGKELKEMLVYWFEDIEKLSSKLTSGNVSHQGATVRNKAIRCSKFIKEYCKTKDE